MSGSKPHLLVLNQYYAPGVEATAHLLHQICVALAKDFDVTVVTGRLSEVDVPAGVSVEDGVTVIRVRSTAFERRRLPLRAVNYLTYFLMSGRAAFGRRKPDVVLCMTDPPFIANLGLLVARAHRAPLVVVSQDVFPEVAVELGRLQNPTVVWLLRKTIEFYLRRADRVVAIGETMRVRLNAKGAPAERLRVIPNWVDTHALEPVARVNEWSHANDLDDRFVVMHSGNIGHAQNLDALIQAGSFMRDLDRLTIALIGGGARRAELAELAERLDVTAVRFMPYQPRELLSQSLSSADIHVVGLAHGLSGYVVPSRLYGIMSVGRPVIVAADADSETAHVVEQAGCGIVVPPNDPPELARAIRKAYDGELPLEEMGRQGREYVVREGDRTIAVERYRSLLRELVGDIG